MQPPVKRTRYGKEVWESPADYMRREECMCLHCGHFHPDDPGNHCIIAADLYSICVQHGNALMMTRCASWRPIQSEEVKSG